MKTKSIILAVILAIISTVAFTQALNCTQELRDDGYGNTVYCLRCCDDRGYCTVSCRR